MPTNFVCPNGHLVTLGVEFYGTGFSRGPGGGQLIGVECPECGAQFDGGPKKSGIYSTSPTGELRQVAEWVRSASLDELRAMREELQRARSANSPEMAKAALAKAGLTGYEKTMLWLTILTVIVPLLTWMIDHLMAGEKPTPPEIDIYINHCVEEAKKGQPKPAPVIEVHVEQQADDFVHPDQKFNKNDPCPCGSKRRYKRCHGGASRP